MPLLRSLAAGLRNLVRERQSNADIDAELQSFVEESAGAKVRLGTAPDEARRTARIEAGAAEAIRERIRDFGWERTIYSALQDLRYAARALRKNPGFSLAVVVTLSLGIAANTTIFSIANGILFRPLPVRNPEQLTFLAYARAGASFDEHFSFPEFHELSAGSASVFSNLSAFSMGGLTSDSAGQDGLTVEGSTQSVQTAFVSGNYFQDLGIAPALGRFILPGEGASPGADPVVVLSYRYWKSRFAGDPSIVGKRAAINGHALTVVGVAPRNFYGLTPLIDMQAYLPLGMMQIEERSQPDFMASATDRHLILVGRLRPGVSAFQAASALAGFGERLWTENPRPGERKRILVKALRPPGLINGHNPLPLLAGMFLTLAALVLLLASLNVANLMLARASTRAHELAVRSALGASRARLTRQALTESTLLALLSAVTGVALGTLGCVYIASLSTNIQLPLVADFHLDWRVCAYSLTVALIAGVLPGMVPALRATFGNVSIALRDSGRGATSRQRMRTALVAAQIGGSLALLIAAGLFARSVQMSARADLGFDPHNVLNLTVSPLQIGYSEAQGRQFYARLLERVRALPGVQSASLTLSIPVGDTVNGFNIEVPGHSPPRDAPVSAESNSVSPEFFSTMRIPVLRGRDFTEADGADATRVAIVNQKMAEHYWPGQNPVGQQFTILGAPRRTVQIVGVIRDYHTQDMYSPIGDLVVLPLAQDFHPVQTLQVRSLEEPGPLAESIRSASSALAPEMPVYNVETMDDELRGMNGLGLWIVGAQVASAIGLAGLAISVVGLYGVISYSVSTRTQEIGVRMALGASRSEILRMIGFQSLRILAVSLPAGLAVALLLGMGMNDFLVGIKPTDPLTYGVVTTFLTVVALFAGTLPARRATLIHPAIALRHE